MKTDDGRLTVVGGATRCGKTAWTKSQVDKAPRVFAWDPEGQWAALPGWVKVGSKAQLLAAIQKPGKARIAFVVGGDLKAGFDYWAKCVFFSGRLHGACVAIAEELADVTTPSKAPGNWGILLRRGLKYGISIYAISQRWSEADKTAFGNASEYVLFRQSSVDDVRYLSRKTRVHIHLLERLPQFHFIRYDTGTFKATPGKLSFAR